MPGGFPIDKGRSPGVVLVPGVGASFLGVGVLDFRLGVDDLSFCNREIILSKFELKTPHRQENPEWQSERTVWVNPI